MKNFVLACLVIALCAALAFMLLYPNKDQSKAMDLRLSCERLVHQYPIPRDAKDAKAYGELFTEDAQFILRGETTNGREAIVNALVSRSSDTTTRHVTGSVNVTDLGGGEGQGISYALVFSAKDAEQGKPIPLDQSSLFAVVTYLDKFKIENDKCLFSQRKVNIDFLANTQK